jgi:cyclophilin family peptidyl-prolyl cis-trans isomerase
MKIISYILLLMLSANVTAQNKFSKDATLRKIYGFEYNRLSDSLLPYFLDKNQQYRYAAIRAVASVQDTMLAPPLIKMMSTEKNDSVQLSIINSLSQLDCYTAYYFLLEYYNKCANMKVKNACMASIGKLAKHDVTDFYINNYNQNQIKDEHYLMPWLKGLYLAKRRKQVDLEKNNRTLAKHVDSLLENNLGSAELINYYCHKIMPVALIAAEQMPPQPVKSKAQIDEQLKPLTTPYLQLKKLKEFILTDVICKQLVFSDYHPLIRAYALDNFFNNHTWNNVIDAEWIQNIFDQNDVALTSRMCEYIVVQNEQKKKIPVTVDVLQNVQRQLLLPRDFETWIDVEKAILSFSGQSYNYRSCFENGYSNPIDWEYIVKIEANQKVKILTSKGVMIMMLKVNEAPASVCNFLKLVDQGYYNGKYFHRMVPNFVVQGGCPRGDGWGSLDWNQRSELSGTSTYHTGSVGLASVGKDSEGVQFFISHTYAPHLDGRYTIFGDIIKGLQVISNLQVGDQILKIERM